MHPSDNLALSLRLLKSPEESDQTGEGIVLVFSKGGVGQYATPLAAHRLLPGDALVFRRTAGSKITVGDKEAEFLFWIFSVHFENLLPLFACQEISRLRKLMEGFKHPKIHPAGSSLAMECRRLLEVVPPQFNLDHRGQLIRIAATMLSVEFSQITFHPGGHARTEDQMARFFDRLSASELINLSVGELAGRFNCSRRHLNRLFHQHFGVSVASLKMEMRLLKAVSLLQDANEKIVSVAEQCGFHHAGQFHTHFKRRFGASPGVWRKSTFQKQALPAGNSQHRLSSAGGQQAATFPPMMASIAGKIANGDNILEDLKHRNLLFSAPSADNNAEHHSTAGVLGE